MATRAMGTRSGGDNAEADGRATVRDEDDFDSDEIEKTTHDQAEQTDLRR